MDEKKKNELIDRVLHKMNEPDQYRDPYEDGYDNGLCDALEELGLIGYDLNTKKYFVI